ncbi:MAG: CPBP family intramembrane glutamate endopeptidase, partial [Cyanobacteriota bacterium]
MVVPAPSTPVCPPPQSGGPPPQDGWRGWKGLLAVLALCLSGLIWIAGLVDSLSRPSVVNALDIRELELSVLAAESLPPSVRPFLVGDDPRGALITALEKRLQDAESPATAAQRLEIALLRREKAGQDPRPGDGALAELVPQVDVQRRALLEALQRDVAVHPRDQAALLAPWGEDSLVAQLGCEQLGGPATACPAHRRGPWLVARLFAITLLPALLLLAGLVLLSRTLWFALRGRLPAPPPLVGPPLSLVDATLVIAGGFVLLGEVLLPAFTQAGLTRVLASMGLSATTRQGVDVMATYLTLMVAP